MRTMTSFLSIALLSGRPVIVVPEGGAVDAAQLRQYLRDKVARFWLPEYWSFSTDIPKTSVGKLDKKRLRDLNQAGQLEVEEVRS